MVKVSLEFKLALAPPGTPPEAVECPCCGRIWEDLHVHPIPLRVDGPPTTAALANAVREPTHVSTVNRMPVQQQRSLVQSTMTSSAGRYGGGGAEASTRAAAGGASVGVSAGGSSSSTRAVADADAADCDACPNCQCGRPAVRRVVSKQGPNHGRPFFVCSGPKESPDHCDYFLWADEPPQAQAARNGRRNVFENPRAAGMADASHFHMRSVVCSSCKEPGHYERECCKR